MRSQLTFDLTDRGVDETRIHVLEKSQSFVHREVLVYRNPKHLLICELLAHFGIFALESERNEFQAFGLAASLKASLDCQRSRHGTKAKRTSSNRSVEFEFLDPIDTQDQTCSCH